MRMTYNNHDQRVVLQTVVSGETETDDRSFVYGNYIDEVLVMRRFLPTPFDYYFAHDHLYSPAAVYGQGGAVLERYEYDAYGQPTILSTNYEPRTTSLYANAYYFTGRELDNLDFDATGNPQLKIMYYRARSYDPQTGRFMQRDPLGINPAGGLQNPFDATKQYLDGTNVYQYVESSPTIRIDPFGLRCPRNTCDNWFVSGISTFEIGVGIAFTAVSMTLWPDPECCMDYKASRLYKFRGIAFGLGVPISFSSDWSGEWVKTACVRWNSWAGGGGAVMAAIGAWVVGGGYASFNTPVASIKVSGFVDPVSGELWDGSVSIARGIWYFDDLMELP